MFTPRLLSHKNKLVYSIYITDKQTNRPTVVYDFSSFEKALLVKCVCKTWWVHLLQFKCYTNLVRFCWQKDSEREKEGDRMEYKVYLVIMWSSSTDNYWSTSLVYRFIDFCVASKAYTGVDFVEDDEMVDDIMQRLDAINLNGGLSEEEEDGQ